MSGQAFGIHEDDYIWRPILCWQWCERTVIIISGLRDFWVLLALCLRCSCSCSTRGDSSCTFLFTQHLLQRLRKRFKVTRIFPLLIKNLVKTRICNIPCLVIQPPMFLWPGRVNTSDKLFMYSYGVSATILQRERHWILVCAQKSHQKCYDFSSAFSNPEDT